MKKKETILIVEDEYRIRRMLKDLLKSLGYETIEAEDGQLGCDLFYKNNTEIDLILLDLMMPQKNGLEVLQEIRQYSDVPIVVLTAKGEEYDQLACFKSGADDFVMKPFSPAVLLAHVEAVLKRCNKTGESQELTGNLIIEPDKMSIRLDDTLIELTPKEYDLLQYFIQNQDIILSRDAILNSVWGYDYEGDLRTVDTHVKQIRAKLANYSNYIKTVHGVGYRFEVGHE